MVHKHRCARLTTLLVGATVSAVLCASGAPPAGASASAPSGGGAAAATPAPVCAGALSPVPDSVWSPSSSIVTVGDSAGPGSVFMLARAGQVGGTEIWSLRHGPATGPFTETPLSATPDVVADDIVAVDAQHAWIAGEHGGHAAVWRVVGDTVSEVPIPPGLLPPTSTWAHHVDASSDHDVWVAVEGVSGRQQTNTVLHWDGTAWTAVPGMTTRGILVTVAVVGRGTALALLYTGYVDKFQWYASHGGRSWRKVAGPGGELTDPVANLSPGHGRPVAQWTPPGDPTGSAPLLSQWRDGAWHTLPPTPVPVGGAAVAPDGSVWTTFDDTRPRSETQTPYTVSYPRSIAVLDGDTWVRSGTLEDPALTAAALDGYRWHDLVALNSAQAIAPGYDFETGPSLLGRSCFATVSARGVTNRAVQTEVGLPIAVRGTPDLPGPLSLHDDLGVRPPTQVSAGHWAQLSYPWAGSFTTTVGTDHGSIRTTTAMPSWETTSKRVIHQRLLLATRPVPAGWSIEVQQQLPGRSIWHTVTLTDQPQLELPQIRRSQIGTWHFRARLVRTDGTASSGWSAISTVTRRDVAR